MKTRLHIIFASILLLYPLLLYAQPRRLTGTVMGTDGLPVIGAGVICKESPRNGAVTDIDGRFGIDLPSGVKTVVFSSLGMKDVEYDVTSNPIRDITVTMEYEQNQLDQVVVTGYAQTTVKRITGSVGILSAEKFESKPLSSVSALMQGEIAGVSVSATSGQPGTKSRIRIRGTNNLSGNSDPLWVVDGVPMQNESPELSSEQLATGGFDNIFVNGVGNINPNDIESITILKDAAAAAIYGSRAANGVIVVTTKKGEAGRMKVRYNNNFTWSFRPQQSLARMNSAEKLAWEQELWDEFSAKGYEKSLTDNTAIYPVIGIVGQIRAGVGDFVSMKGDKAAQDAFIESLKGTDTDWYGLLFRNAFSHNHHLSLSGGSDKYTYYVAGGFNKDSGMLIHNDYNRYNLNANMTMKPSERVRLDVGVESSMQKSVSPDSYVNAFTYAYFANPYEKVFEQDGSYAADHTYFSLGYYNGRGVEEVMPENGFNIIRELSSNSTSTTNSSQTLRGQIDLTLAEGFKFTGLASYTHSGNSTDKTVDKDTYTAFRDRLGNDDKSQTNLYGNIAQNRTDRSSYVVRGHFSFNRTFKEHHTLNMLAGAEIRGTGSNTIFSKRYNYDKATGTTSLPPISGPADQWLSEVERLNGQYFNDIRYASFYASADYYLKKTFVFNTSFRTDGSSNFGSNRQFNPTWSAGAAWHIGEEEWATDVLPALSHATLRVAGGFTGDVNTGATHLLVMNYTQQEYRNYGGNAYKIATFPSAPNPDLGWEKTMDAKVGFDFGMWKDRLNINTEAYYRKSSDVVTSSQVQSTTGFSLVSFNSADLMNSGIETTVNGKIINGRDFTLGASVNFSYNYNKVLRYRPAVRSKITSKDRYVEGYPAYSIFSGRFGGIDSFSGLYKFRIREDADINGISDLNDPDNYRYYLGTSISPFTGGFNISIGYKRLKASFSGVYSFGAKVREKIDSPASYLKARHDGFSTEEIQSQFSDLYSNHLNVDKDRTERWTESRNSGTKYPRIYDRFDAIYNFAATNPMDYSIIDAIYIKDVSYLRLKTALLSWSLPEGFVKKVGVKGASIHISFNNFLTLTGYDGMDPEIPGATYPTTRSVSGGVNIDF